MGQRFRRTGRMAAQSLRRLALTDKALPETNSLRNDSLGACFRNVVPAAIYEFGVRLGGPRETNSPRTIGLAG